MNVGDTIKCNDPEAMCDNCKLMARMDAWKGKRSLEKHE